MEGGWRGVKWGGVGRSGVGWRGVEGSGVEWSGLMPNATPPNAGQTHPPKSNKPSLNPEQRNSTQTIPTWATPTRTTLQVNWEFVRCLENGECVSVDGTHLGHNLPDRTGNRYCINLGTCVRCPFGGCVSGALRQPPPRNPTPPHPH